MKIIRRVLIIVIFINPLLLISQAEDSTHQELSKVINLAVENVLNAQESDGAWPYEGVYRVGGNIPIGYKVGGTAIVCQMLLYTPTTLQDKAALAISSGIDFIIQGLKHPQMEPSTKDVYDVRIWGHSYALELFCRLKKARYNLSETQEKSVNEWIPKLKKTLITEEVPGGGWNYGTRQQQASFVTAPVVQALLWARSNGEDVPDDILKRSRDVLQKARYSSGAFAYSGQTQSSAGDGKSILPGSIARSAICESTLMLLGTGSTAAIKNAIDSFHKYWIELEKRRQKPGTHEPPYGVAPYYFYYGHYYAAQALEMLPEDNRLAGREKMRTLVLGTRDKDGTWNDRVFRRSRSFGTAMAVMAILSDRIPLPDRVSLK